MITLQLAGADYQKGQSTHASASTAPELAWQDESPLLADVSWLKPAIKEYDDLVVDNMHVGRTFVAPAYSLFPTEHLRMLWLS